MSGSSYRLTRARQEAEIPTPTVALEATIYGLAVSVTSAAASCIGGGPRAAMSAQSATPIRDGSPC
jgi:hypothetical protein